MEKVAMTSEEKSVKRRLISFSNYSTCLTLPKKALEKLGWRRGDVISVDVDFGKGQMVLRRGGGRVGVEGPKTELTASEPVEPSPDAQSSELRW